MVSLVLVVRLVVAQQVVAAVVALRQQAKCLSEANKHKDK
jgi:hypothetical protein